MINRHYEGGKPLGWRTLKHRIKQNQEVIKEQYSLMLKVLDEIENEQRMIAEEKICEVCQDKHEGLPPCAKIDGDSTCDLKGNAKKSIEPMR